jgi:hypothetical protein
MNCNIVIIVYVPPDLEIVAALMPLFEVACFEGYGVVAWGPWSSTKACLASLAPNGSHQWPDLGLSRRIQIPSFRKAVPGLRGTP